MKNPTQPTVKLELDGEEYELLFDLESIAVAEDATGQSLILGLGHREVNAPRISMIRALFWASLRVHQPKITLAEASLLVTQWNAAAVWGKVIEAWVAGMKKPGADGDDPTPAQS